jgi:hypothetical protein
MWNRKKFKESNAEAIIKTMPPESIIKRAFIRKGL